MCTKTLQSYAQIKEFVDTHIIPPEVAKDYMHHLCQLNIMKATRAKDKSGKREEKKKRQYDEYKCQALYLNGGMDKLLVEDLNKYLAIEKFQIIKFNSVICEETQKI